MQPKSKTAILHDEQHKPSMPSIDATEIPESLKLTNRWLVWRWTWEAKRKVWSKPPRNVRTGRKCDGTAPANWCSFAEALAAHEANPEMGIGFALGQEGDLWYAGADLDDCRDPETGELSELAHDVIGALDTFTEISPSASGIKLLAIAKSPPDKPNKNTAGTLELYSSGRYFTLTAQRVEGTPKRVEDRQEQLATVWQRYIGSEQPASGQPEGKNAERQQQPDAQNGIDVAALAAMLKVKPRDDESDGSKRLIRLARQVAPLQSPTPFHQVASNISK